jgi:hypothetical protein
MSPLQSFRERSHIENWSIYLVEMGGMFLRTFSVEVAYIYMWRVCDLDLGSMIKFSTRVNKT